VQVGRYIGAVFEEEDAILKSPVIEGRTHGGWGTIGKSSRGCDNNRIGKGVSRTKSGSEFVIDEPEEERVREECDISIVVNRRGMVRSMGQCIRGTEVFSRDMLEGKVIFEEGAVPSGLLSA
jgi:hypothetical protein